MRVGSAKPMSPTCETLKLPGTARTGKSRSRSGVPSEEPLERELRRGMASALSGVAAVVAVDEEDREVWRVEGSPSGEELLRAAARAWSTLSPTRRGTISTVSVVEPHRDATARTPERRRTRRPASGARLARAL